MSKRIFALIIAIVMVFSVCALTSCTNSSADFKVGFIFLHDDNSTYDRNFMEAARQAAKNAGLSDDQVLFEVGIDESNDCYDAAARLVDKGCKLVFADSFGHEPFMIKAAKEFKDVQFFHATGTQAHTEKLPNYHNAFASIYEGRYLAGVVAGLKLKAMIDAGTISGDSVKIGYVGAHPYAEVVSGYTSFFLGVRSIVANVTMDVRYTNSWFDIAKEREAALQLINDGCVLLSQHADSEGAPKACEENNVPNVAYNVSTISIGPKTALISSKIDWTPYMEMIIKKVMDGKGSEIPYDWCGGFEEGAVKLTELNADAAADGTQAKLDEITAQLKAGTLHVFDTSKFTINGGQTVTTYLADVDDDGSFTGETEVIKDGYFHESEYRSAPYFDLRIDGITEK